jgi:hypothetical protein
MSSSTVFELRRMLAEKFPAFRGQGAATADPLRYVWPTGFPHIDGRIDGFVKGGITEIVAENASCGAATIIRALLERAAGENKIVAMIDGADSLDVTSMDAAVLARLLWVRCGSAEQAMKAADLILRDNNFPLVFLDLVALPPAQLRKISPTAWYRFQRLLENSTTVALAFTPRPMIAPAAVRLTVKSKLNFASLEQPRALLLPAMDLLVSKRAHTAENIHLKAAG